MKTIKTDPPKVAYSVAEVVKATSLGKTSIYNHISAGRLHAVRVGGRRLILAKSLEAFLKGED